MARPRTGVTPVRNTRIPDDVWLPALTIAQARGETLTSVIEAALCDYIARHHDELPDTEAAGQDS